MTRVHNTWASGARAMAVPGWPEFAFRGASMARPLMTLMPSCSIGAAGPSVGAFAPVRAEVSVMGPTYTFPGVSQPRDLRCYLGFSWEATPPAARREAVGAPAPATTGN